MPSDFLYALRREDKNSVSCEQRKILADNFSALYTTV
jgi:hypothetical protein